MLRLMFLAGAIAALVKKRPGLAVAALAGLAACGRAPDFVTENGVEVFANGLRFRREQVQRMETWAVRRLPEMLGTTKVIARAALLGLSVYAHQSGPDQFFRPCGDSLEPCRGFFSERDNTVHIGVQPCEYATNYLHELAHRVMLEATGDADGQHLHPVWRKDPEGVFREENPELLTACSS